MNSNLLKNLTPYLWELPATYKKHMRVPARIYGTASIVESMDNAVIEQIANVATLPGIMGEALCMPDGHSGYGFPIGGVAAIDPDEGIISPGGIGFDINCGVRLIVTDLSADEMRPRLKDILSDLFRRVPSGIGPGGLVPLKGSAIDDAMVKGAEWAVEKGYGEKVDLDYTEEGGRISPADPSRVSNRARERGKGQMGSLGSGNHYLEFQIVPEGGIFDHKAASAYGIHREGQVAVMIHSGSRGFGHQIASDYLDRFLSVMTSVYGISVPDRELACAPFRSRDGQDYFHAMNCAINIAFLNRQLLMHAVRECLCGIFRKSNAELGIKLVYDVCHNTAKLEEHVYNGTRRTMLIHRKGATRAFFAGMKGLPGTYSDVGQPVLVGGSMESGSYVMRGVPSSAQSWCSSSHGSGRVLSRHQAKRQFNGKALQKNLEKRGILVMTSSFSGLGEEAGGAYKNIDDVAEATDRAGLSALVAKLVPIACIKG